MPAAAGARSWSRVALVLPTSSRRPSPPSSRASASARRLLSVSAQEFKNAVAALVAPGAASFALAGINLLLSKLTSAELRDAVANAPEVDLSAFLANYVSAMVETACARHGIPVPAWSRNTPPLDQPVFGSELESLRLHLLVHSPAAFRRRNIFIDSSVGDQI